jgi:hypothetical protein
VDGLGSRPARTHAGIDMTKQRIPESAVQRHIVATLRQVGGDVWELGTKRSRRDHHMGTRQTPGLPDVIAFLPARATSRKVLLIVEAKAAGGRLRPEQVLFRQCCLEADVAHVVGGLDAVVDWLIRHAYLKPEHVAHYRRPSDQAIAAAGGC